MLSLRRYVTYCVFAGFLIFVFTYLRNPLLSTGRQNYASGFGDDSSLDALRDPNTGRIRWDLITTRYPVTSPVPLPTGEVKYLPKVQYDFPEEAQPQAVKRKDRQDAVKKTFERAWNAYKQRAWMRDEIAPLSGLYRDHFGGWAATLVDSLDTLWIMGLKSEFEKAVEAAMEINLDHCTTQEINVFETTIRHLGSLLSAYDLSGDERLLDKAKEFGNMLIVAFDTPNRMPITRWRLFESLRGDQEADSHVLIAEIGSLSMEFTRLSMLTGDPKWWDAVMRIYALLEEQQHDTFLSGMWPVTVNAEQADFTSDSLFTLSAMSDSLYEYFPKMHALLGGLDPTGHTHLFQKLYEGSMAGAIRYNLFRPMTPDSADILVSGQIRKSSKVSQAKLDPQGQHLVCFAGGMFALGSKLFDNPEHLEIGKKIMKGCVWAYQNSPLGIMPEKFRMVACDSKQECPWDESKWRKGVLDENPDGDVDESIKKRRLPLGFTEIVDTRYILRPEAIESVFVLYRITGDESLLETAWDMFEAINSATQTPLGNAALIDVTYSKSDAEFNGVKMDSMESFWMAETLKYFYLIFSEPDVINLDEWVFNTEAHPFRRKLPRKT